MSHSASAEAQRRIESCASGSFFPSSIWWKGPAEIRKATAEPDQYGTVAKVDAKAWEDDGRFLLFGPDRVSKRNPYPKWSHTIVAKGDRFNNKMTKLPAHAKTELDVYGAKNGDSFLNKKFDRRSQFTKTNSACELKRKIKHNTVFRKFNKDFTVSGSALAF